MPKSYGFDPQEIARLHWQEKLSTHEIAARYGCCHHTIRTYIRKAGADVRDRLSALPCAEKNGAWKGSEAGYNAMHRRVRTLRGTPSLCERCGRSDPDAFYEWASVSRNYADPSDYIRLCRACHMGFDGHVKKRKRRAT